MQNIDYTKTNLLLLIILIINLSYSYGLDKTQNPIVINSGNFTIDYTNGYALYSKNVVLNQDDKNLQSDDLYIYFETDSKNKKINSTQPNTSIKTIVATSKNQINPVVYTQKVNSKNNFKSKVKNNSKNSGQNIMLAKAEIIKFNTVDNKIILEKNATIEQNNKTLTSELIHYDLKNEIAYMPKVNNQRSKIVLG